MTGYRIEITRGGDVAWLRVTVDLSLRTSWALTLDDYEASRYATIERAERHARIAARRFEGARVEIIPF